MRRCGGRGGSGGATDGSDSVFVGERHAVAGGAKLRAAAAPLRRRRVEVDEVVLEVALGELAEALLLRVLRPRLRRVDGRARGVDRCDLRVHLGHRLGPARLVRAHRDLHLRRVPRRLPLAPMREERAARARRRDVAVTVAAAVAAVAAAAAAAAAAPTTAAAALTRDAADVVDGLENSPVVAAF